MWRKSVRKVHVKNHKLRTFVMNLLVHIRQKKKFAQEIEAEIASGSKLNRYLGILVQIQKVLHKNKSLFPIKLEVTACFFFSTAV